MSESGRKASVDDEEFDPMFKDRRLHGSGRETTVDTWRGRKARITPSGHIHLIEAMSHRDTFDRDVAIMACGKEVRRSYLTLQFPPEGRHCRPCFPEVTP